MKENEIHEFCEQLEKMWQERPQQRFLQLLYNTLILEYHKSDLNAGELYNLKDEELLEVIKSGKFVKMVRQTTPA